MENEKENEKVEIAPEYSSLIVLEEEYPTLLTRKYLQRKPYAPINHKMIYAFIPGTIRKIYLKENDKVKKGEKILILEAMKMENELTPIVSGKIKKIHVKTGEMVTKNQLLVELV